jgi:hypothetical protein
MNFGKAPMRGAGWADEVENGCYLAAETAGRAAGRTKPDLHLIKQVEQVTTFVLAGACQDSDHRMKRGGRGCGIFNLTIIWFADVSLQKTAKTARSYRRRGGQAVA